MLHFECDYCNGAHEKVLEALVKTNGIPTTGYGDDEFTASAIAKIRAACEAPNAAIRFIGGGTQTNQVAIAALLGRAEGVVCCSTGHIHVHEAGAIEYTGHKTLPLPHHNGKLSAGDLSALLASYDADESREHTVYPGMVYISHPTEYGTLYSLDELTAISEVCRARGIPLFLDGARLGYGLCGDGTDVTLPDIAQLCDVFYIGGTKVGALCGEALVFPQGNEPKRFLSYIKQNGALLAKGRLCGVQFDALFTDGLYFEIGRYAMEMAHRLRDLFRDRGYRFFLDSPTNQQFIVLDKQTADRLAKDVVFTVWEPVDEDHVAVRFAASWSTTEEDLEKLAALL